MLALDYYFTGDFLKDKTPPSWWDKNKDWVILLIVVVAISLVCLACYLIVKTKENHSVPRKVTFYGYGIKDYPYGSYLYPDIPEKEGYVFMGWYKDTTFVEPWKSTDKVTRDITLYPKWVKEG